MKTFKGYINYGVLGSEKKKIFTAENPHYNAIVSDKIEITVPEDFWVGENDMGELLIETPDGTQYLAKKIIGSYDGEPVLEWLDGKKEHRVKCQWREI